MMPRITILESHFNDLRNWLTSDPQKHERGAILLFRRLSRLVEGQPASDRFLVISVIKMEGDWVLNSSERHLTINMRKMPEIYFQCEKEELEFGFAHSHPNGYLNFSEQDNENEKNILYGLSNCNGKESSLVSLIISENKWAARIRKAQNPEITTDIKHICVLGKSMELYGIRAHNVLNDSLARQETAFGKPFNLKVNSLRAVVVGVGGVGSAVATLLARSGVGELVLIDGDPLESSNMNRVRGYNSSHVTKNKAESLAEFIESLGLNTSVSAIPAHLTKSEEAIDALSSADIVFGCTDDIRGRDIMNQALYYYLFAYIDCGLTGRITEDEIGEPCFRDHRGRVSCILPTSGACLRCQNVISDKKLEFEQAMIDHPELLEVDPETLERDFYLIGGGVQAPGVGPFTSATADNAVACFMDLIKNYRNLSPDFRQDNIWIDFVHLSFHSNTPTENPNCIFCQKLKLLLKKESKFRLDTPSLGVWKK